MRMIHNPYNNLNNHCCFGCSTVNPVGLKLRFMEDGDEIISEWIPEGHFEGFTGVLHGGIQATMHDEIASWVVFVKVGTAGFTQELAVKYHVPVLLATGPIRLRSRLRDMDGNRANVATALYDGKGTLCSEALVVYFTVPAHIAMRKFAYPGQEAFLTE
jgi:acyl-coenzyme A thioesterase PaaI-like protein